MLVKARTDPSLTLALPQLESPGGATTDHMKEGKIGLIRFIENKGGPSGSPGLNPTCACSSSTLACRVLNKDQVKF